MAAPDRSSPRSSLLQLPRLADVFAIRTPDRRVRALRLYAMRLFAPAVAIVVQGLLLRVIGLGGVGTYAVLTTVIGLLATLGTREAPQALSRSLATAPDLTVALNRYRRTNRLVFLTMAVLVAAFVVAGPFILPLLNINVRLATIAVVGLTSVATAAQSVYLGAARGLDRLTAATGVDLLLGRVLFAAYLLAMWVVADRTTSSFGLSWALVGLLASTATGVAVGALWIWGRDLIGDIGPPNRAANGGGANTGDRRPANERPPDQQATGSDPTDDGAATSNVLVLNQVVLFLAGVLGLWVLHRSASPEEAGTFHVANRLALVAGIPGVVAQFTLGPRLARAAEAGTLPGLMPTIRRHVALASVAMLGLGTAVFAVGPTIIDVIGGDRLTLPLTGPLLILLVGQLVHVSTGPCGYALIMAGEEWLTLVATALGTITVLGLAVTLVPSWGTDGAATATAVGIAVTNLANLIGLWQTKRIVTVVGFPNRVGAGT